jgi:hypothetical protein
MQRGILQQSPALSGQPRMPDPQQQQQQQQHQQQQQQAAANVHALQQGLHALLLQNSAVQAGLLQQQQSSPQDAAASMQRALSGASARSGSLESGMHWSPSGSRRQLSSVASFGSCGAPGSHLAPAPGSVGLAAAAEHLSTLQTRPSLESQSSMAALMAAAANVSALQERAASLAGSEAARVGPGSPWAGQAPTGERANPFAGGDLQAALHAANGASSFGAPQQQQCTWGLDQGLSPKGSAGSLGTPAGFGLPHAQPELPGTHAGAQQAPNPSAPAAPLPSLPSGSVAGPWHALLAKAGLAPALCRRRMNQCLCCAGLVTRAAGRLLAAQQQQQQQQQDVAAKAKLLLGCLVKARHAAAQASTECLQAFQVQCFACVLSAAKLEL